MKRPSRFYQAIQAVNGIGVLSVAADLDLAVRESRGASGGQFSPCPLCNADHRHTKRKDKRYAVGVRSDDAGWRCFQCDEAGDAADLVALYRYGHRCKDLPSRDKEDFSRWAADRYGGVDAVGHARPLSRPIQRPEPKPEPPPNYPSQAEVAELWAHCTAVYDDAAVAAWLRDERAIDPGDVTDRDLARVLPEGRLPTWAGMSERWTWHQSGHRLVVPLFDAAGAMRSMLARTTSKDAERKSLAASTYARTGLVMADAGAQLVLQKRELAPNLRVVIGEGEVDYLTWATEETDASETALVVFGMFQGGWGQAHADRIPDGAVVTIATDHDADGDKYADAIKGTFKDRHNAGKVRLKRW